MLKGHRRTAALLPMLLLPTMFARIAKAQQTPVFTPGNIVVLVEGCGVQGGTCTVTNGTGTGTGNSSNGGYGDNQAAPMTLFQYTPNGTASVTYVNSLVMPQTASGKNFALSGEYGSSSEGAIQLSGGGQFLTFMGYGINAATYNASPNTYGAVSALAQSNSVSGEGYTTVPRVITLVDPYGNINTATAIYNVFDTNNPRSMFTAGGQTAYISGQGSGTDSTGGVFYVPIGGVVTSPTAITGLDTSTKTIAQDTRLVQIYNGTLYVSADSKEGSGSNRSFIGTLGSNPTGLYNSGAGPTQITEANNTGSAVSSAGKMTLTAAEENSVNSTAAGSLINLSPSGYFFANAATMYVADTGSPKNNSAGSSLPNTLGDGGLQKWVNTKSDGTGTWELMYTLSAGLNLVQNPTSKSADVSGATGLYSVTGVVNGTTVNLYAVNYNISDLDPTYLYGITDTLATTTNPGTSFTQLAAAPLDSNFKGVTLAPSLPAGSATLTSSPSGLSITTAGTGCAAGTYVTPVTLSWTPGSTCTLTTSTPQSSGSLQYVFSQWQDNTTSTTDTVIAPSASAVYTATFTNTYQPVGVLEKAVDSSTSTAEIHSGDSVLISGWVADPVDGSPLSNVTVYLDGNSLGTPTLGISRPDVAQAYNNSTYGSSGYQLTTSSSSLSQASHAVTVVAVDSSGRSTTFGPLTINVVASPFVFLAGSGGVGSLSSSGSQATGLTANGGTGAAVDGSGNVWSLDANGAGVSEFNSMGAASGDYTSAGLSGASALAIDGNSNLVIGNGTGLLSILSNAGAAISTIAGSTTAAPASIAIDLSGNIWVANGTGNTVDEVIGGAAPAAPLATAVQNTTTGVKP